MGIQAPNQVLLTSSWLGGMSYYFQVVVKVQTPHVACTDTEGEGGFSTAQWGGKSLLPTQPSLIPLWWRHRGYNLAKEEIKASPLGFCCQVWGWGCCSVCEAWLE